MIRDQWMKLPPLLRAILPGLVLTIVAAGAFVAVLDEVLDGDTLETLDQPLLEFLVDIRTPWLTTVMTGITEAFGPVVLPILIVVGCAIWFWRTRSWRDPLMLAGAMILSTALSMGVKGIVARARPDAGFQTVPGYETSFSFPSGHTTGAATLVLVTAYLLWHRRRGKRVAALWALGAVVVTALVGGTRLYLGYHFLTDVFAGACVGLAVLGLVIAVDRWLDLHDATHSTPEERPRRDEV